MSTETDFKTTSIRLPPSLVADIDDLASDLGHSRGWVIEQACKVYLDRRNALPSIDWSTCDESGSCGFSYRLGVTFSIPSAGQCDQAAYAFRDDFIERLSLAGAREIYTDIHGIRPLEWVEDAFEDVTTRDSTPEEDAILITHNKWSNQQASAERWVWTGAIWQKAPCNHYSGDSTPQTVCDCLPSYVPCIKGHNPNIESCHLCPWYSLRPESP